MGNPLEMEARGAEPTFVSRGPGKAKLDPCRFGWRYRFETTADGRRIAEQVPLTYEEFLYPEEDYVLGQGLIHFLLLHPWADALRRFLKKKNPSLLVTCDVFLLVGRRLTEEKRYEEIPADADGRVFSEQLGLCFAIDADSQELMIFDAETGQRLRLSDEEEQRAEAEAEARQRAEAEVARLERELRRLRGAS